MSDWSTYISSIQVTYVSHCSANHVIVETSANNHVIVETSANNHVIVETSPLEDPHANLFPTMFSAVCIRGVNMISLIFPAMRFNSGLCNEEVFISWWCNSTSSQLMQTIYWHTCVSRQITTIVVPFWSAPCLITTRASNTRCSHWLPLVVPL